MTRHFLTNDRARCALMIAGLALSIGAGCEGMDGSDLGETAATASAFTLAWDDNANDEDGYRVERKLGDTGVFALAQSLPANTSSYVDGLLEPAQTYCYRVQAFNAAGASAFTNEACATTPSAPPDAGPGDSGSGSDTQPPTIALTSPADGGVVRGGDKVPLVVTVNDDVGVAAVEFAIDGTRVCTDTAEPFACIWTVSRSRKRTVYTIEATAFDGAGNQSSATATVNKQR